MNNRTEMINDLYQGDTGGKGMFSKTDFILPKLEKSNYMAYVTSDHRGGIFSHKTKNF